MGALQASFFDDLPTPAPRPPRVVPAPVQQVSAPIMVAAPARPPEQTVAPPAAPPVPAVARAAPGDPLRFLPLRPIAWQNLLAKHPAIPVRILVTALYTGAVLETLVVDDKESWCLMRGGEVTDSGLHIDPARIVYMNQEQGLALHAKAPLLPAQSGCWGSMAGSFRFAEPGEALTHKSGAIISGFRAEGQA